MTASNITGGCIVMSNLTNREKDFIKDLTDIAPNEELTLHYMFFFIGKINVAVGAFGYFNGMQYVMYTIKLYDAFALGPFVKMLEAP